MLRDLLKHKAYLMFWGGCMLVFLAIGILVVYELHQIVTLLKK